MSRLFIGSREDSNRREFYRVHFPKGEELTASIDGLDFTILDISEQGMRLAQPSVPHRNRKVRGIIQWYDGAPSYFIGQLGRNCNGRRVIWNVIGISTRQILNEQRRLIRKYLEVKTANRLRLFAQAVRHD